MKFVFLRLTKPKSQFFTHFNSDISQLAYAGCFYISTHHSELRVYDTVSSFYMHGISSNRYGNYINILLIGVFYSFRYNRANRDIISPSSAKCISYIHLYVF